MRMLESRWFLRHVADRIALECNYEAVSDPTIRRAIARCDLDTPELRRATSPAIWWLAVGLDGKGRLIELVYQYDEEEDLFFVFHGMTPPSGKTLRELGLER